MRNLFRSLAFAAVIFSSAKTFSQNQVQVTVQLIPPYSPYLSTYVDQPNKLLLTVQNISTSAQSVKLSVRITGDNGVSVTTSQNFHPSQPIDLAAGEVKNIDFSTPETKDYFDANHVDLAGLTKAQLIQNQALPEGNYQICVRAFDYATGTIPLSPEGVGCANLPVFYIDPPVAVQPICGNDVTESNPQNILFTWTPPATAPGNIQYEFTLKEIPNNLNPNDVIKNNAFPVLFNTTQTAATSLLYTNALPQLEGGKKYVWRVKCIDPNNSVQFKNAGYSDACWFKYKDANTGTNPVITTPVVTDIFNITPPVGNGSGSLNFNAVLTENQGAVFIPAPITFTTLKGKLNYKWSTGPGTLYPMKNAKIRLRVYYAFNQTGATVPHEWYGTYKGVTAGKELAVTSTDDNGNFSFNFVSSFPFGKLEDNYLGEHGIDHEALYGSLYRYASIEILYPHNQYYQNPQKTFSPTLGETFDAGDITAMVKSSKLEVKVKRTGSTTNEMYVNNQAELANANVYLCRKPISAYSQDVFPKDDGLPDENFLFPDKLNGLEVVAKYTTNAEGKVTFTRLARHDNAYYSYFIYADFDKNKTGAYNFVAYNGVEKFKKLGAPEDAQNGFIFDLNTQDGMYYQTIKMSAQYPRVAGMVQDKADGKPQVAIVSLNTVYVSNSNHAVAYLSDLAPQEEIDYAQELKTCPSMCAKKVKRIAIAGTSGEFEFTDLSILYEKNNYKPTGPLHVIKVEAFGYDVKYHGVPEVLHYGEQHYATIELERGAKISGKIVDGETMNPLTAKFYFLDENGHGETKKSTGGEFKNYPAKKLPYKQKLVVEAKNYLSDTMEVLVNSSTVDLGNLKLYTIKRRLTVFVTDAKTGNGIQNAGVEIVGVTEFCKTGSGQYQIYTDCPLVRYTETFLAFATFKFENGGVEANNEQYVVRVKGPDGTDYETQSITTAIPYSGKGTYLQVKLQPATCISGYVYAGKGNSSPVEGAKIKMDVTTPFFWFGNIKTGETEAVTDAKGFFTLHNVALRDYPQVVRAMKSSSELVGDSFVIVTQPANNSNYYNFDGKNYNSNNYGGNMNFNPNLGNTPGNKPTVKSCINHDFHLTVFNDIDITSLMGFPVEVTALKPYGSNGAIIDGYFVSLNGNDQFTPTAGASLEFENIKILPSATIKNAKGIPAATPETTPVTTNNNFLPLQLYGSVDGMVEDKKLGIYLDKDVGGKQYGVIKGRVKMLNTAFNQSVISFSDTFFLALPGESSIAKLIIPVVNADNTIKNPANAPAGFKISNSAGNPVKFSLPGFPGSVLSDYSATTFYNGELNLTAKIQTDIPDITPSNLNIALANIKLKVGVNPTITSANPVSFTMGNWKLSSNDFTLDANGLKLNKGTIDAGVSVPFTDLGIKYNQLLTNGTNIEISNIKLAGVHPVNVVSTNKTFGLVTVTGGKKAWKIYAGPSPDIAATIDNLPALGAGEKIQLSSINLLSNGDQSLVIKSKPVTLKNILKFTPSDASSVDAKTEQFTIPGLFQLNLPDPKSYSASLFYSKSGSSLNFGLWRGKTVSFSHPTQLYHKFTSSPTLTNGKFTYKGTSTESGVFPETNTTLYYTNDSVSVWIDGGQNIPISGARKFANAEGGMRIEGGSWTPFWFSGDVEGMAGISDVNVGGKKQRMKFFVNGQVEADGQSISIKNVETPFGNMSWVYDFPASRLTGHMDLDMNLSATHLSGQVNSIVDGSGWFFGADGMMKVNGLGDVQFAGIFGDYPSYPSGVALNMGDFKCLPSGFNNKVNGFLFQAGIHKQVVPEIGVGIPGLLTVNFGVDVGLTTRLWKSFSEGGNTLGISLLARGHAFANGSCDATCSSVGADANAELSIGGTYSSGTYSINGCGSIGFSLEAEQCLGALGLCSDACVGIDLGGFDLGVNMNYNSSSGADLGLQFKSCSSVCP